MVDLGGGVYLTSEQAEDWKKTYPDEYQEYVGAGLFDELTLLLLDIPEWMNDGDPNNGPFDFALNPSHGTIGW